MASDESRRDAGTVWLATVLSLACLEHRVSRVQYVSLFRAMHDLSQDPTVPFTALNSEESAKHNGVTLPGFYEALTQCYVYGIESDGESSEYVIITSPTAEKAVRRISDKMGPGYVNTVRRHAEKLCGMLATH